MGSELLRFRGGVGKETRRIKPSTGVKRGRRVSWKPKGPPKFNSLSLTIEGRLNLSGIELSTTRPRNIAAFPTFTTIANVTFYCDHLAPPSLANFSNSRSGSKLRTLKQVGQQLSNSPRRNCLATIFQQARVDTHGVK